MKVLLLSCSTGEGHNRAAQALAEEMERRRIPYQSADPVSFRSIRAQATVASLYNNMIRKVPRAFGLVYGAGALYSRWHRFPSPVYAANALYADKLGAFIRSGGFTCAVATHLYGMEALTALKRRGKLDVPAYGVLTDYTSTPFIEETDMDKMFVPAGEAKDMLIRRGWKPERIVVSGIPASRAFYEDKPRAQARAELQIPLDATVFLLMAGGIGNDRLLQLCRDFVSSSRQGELALVMIGRNEAMRKRLRAACGDTPLLRTVSFTDRIADYMHACDVLISKAGGLSSTEAAVAGASLVHYGSIPGCETKNAAFFASHGLSFAARSRAQALEMARTLAYDRAQAEAMRAAQREWIPPLAAADIVTQVCGGDAL
ncbi:MAG: hypothetical protein J6X30_01405 [Clostridia bacterium]|nr:hypothetical protein [Clostridia bacterium]